MQLSRQRELCTYYKVRIGGVGAGEERERPGRYRFTKGATSSSEKESAESAREGPSTNIHCGANN